ncbi:hypothetical protein [Reyranella sp.]|uniref:hypothetical protein n=1 Tax=Reyranella sp. TaxID=1929291 RepID=UPI003D0B234F
MRLSHLVGAALGTGLLFLAAAGAAQAYDHDRYGDRWRHEEWRHDHRYERRHVYERPVVVRERPVYVERARPVLVQPPPVYAAPMYAAPMYQQNQGPSGLNLNFNIPLN